MHHPLIEKKDADDTDDDREVQHWMRVKYTEYTLDTKWGPALLRFLTRTTSSAHFLSCWQPQTYRVARAGDDDEVFVRHKLPEIVDPGVRERQHRLSLWTTSPDSGCASPGFADNRE